MATNLAKLIVRLEAESSKMTAELEKANRKLDKFGKGAKKSAQAAKKAFGLLAGVVAGISFKAMIDEAVNAGSELGNLATRLGGTTEEWSRLKHAAEETDVGFNVAAMAAQRATRRISEAAKGSGEAVDALNELGLSAKKLGELSPVEQLHVLADAFEGVDNQSDKLRIAFKLFDSEGVRILQTMEGGSAALRAYGDEADRFGKTLGQEGASRLKQYEDAMKDLKSSSVGFANILAQALGPTLASIAKWLGEVLPKAARAMGAVFVDLVDQTQTTAEWFAAYQEGHVNFWEWFTAGNDEAAARLKDIKKELGFTTKRLNESVTSFGEFKVEAQGAGFALSEFAGRNEKSTQITKRANETQREFNKLMSEAQAIVEQTMTPIERYQAQIARLNQLREQAPKTVTEDVYLRAVEQYQKQLDEATGKIDKLREAEDARNAILDEGARLTEALRTPQEKYTDDLFRLNDLLQEGAINWETYSRGVEQAQKQLEDAADSTNDAWKDLGLTFTSAFEDAIIEGNNLSDVLKGLERDILRIVMREIITKPMAGAVTDFANGIVGSFFGGARANGGPVSASTPYLVGESGPELFIPNSSGTIEPNHRMGGGGVTINMTVTTPDANSFRQSKRQITQDLSRSVSMAM